MRVESETIGRRLFLARGAAAVAAPALSPAGNSPAAPAGRPGQWQIWDGDTGIVPIHVALLYAPDLGRKGSGRVLYFSGYGPGTRKSFRWTPPTANDPGRIDAASPFDGHDAGREFDLFCSGHACLPNGRLLVAGGTLIKNPDNLAMLYGNPVEGSYLSFVFDSGRNAWTRVGNMDKTRWYPTCIALPSGDVLGMSGWAVHSHAETFATSSIFYNPTRKQWADPYKTTAQISLPMYPRLHVIPSGAVFYVGFGTDEFDFGTSPAAFQTPIEPNAWLSFGSYNTLHASTYGTSVLHIRRDNAGNPIAKIFVFGGGGLANLAVDRQANDLTQVFDLPSTSPVPYMPQAPRMTENMAFARRHHYAVALPNGKILIAGGVKRNYYGENSIGTESDYVLPAEEFDPVSEQFTTLAQAQIGRGYHSCATLLQDGRVATFGTGNPNRPKLQPDDPDLETRIEIYSPAYCFGARPSIGSIMDITEDGRLLDVKSFRYATNYILNVSGGPIERAILIHPGSATHGLNSDQRYVELIITPSARSDAVAVSTPPGRNWAPPGDYLLFVVDTNGAPSEGYWITLQ